MSKSKLKVKVKVKQRDPDLPRHRHRRHSCRNYLIKKALSPGPQAIGYCLDISIPIIPNFHWLPGWRKSAFPDLPPN